MKTTSVTNFSLKAILAVSLLCRFMTTAAFSAPLRDSRMSGGHRNPPSGASLRSGASGAVRQEGISTLTAGTTWP